MTRLLVDTSLLIKWFRGSGESEPTEARAIRDAHVRGDLEARAVLHRRELNIGRLVHSAVLRRRDQLIASSRAIRTM